MDTLRDKEILGLLKALLFFQTILILGDLIPLVKITKLIVFDKLYYKKKRKLKKLVTKYFFISNYNQIIKNINRF